MKTSALLKATLLGLLLSGAMYSHHLTALTVGGDAGCSTSALFDCAKNLRSGYGEWFGIPVSTVAMAAFAFVFVLQLGACIGVSRRSETTVTDDRRFFALPLLFGYAAGAAVLYLLGVSLLVLHSLCLRCSVLYGIVAMTIAVSALGLRRPLRAQPALLAASLRSLLSAHSLPAAVAAVICLGLPSDLSPTPLPGLDADQRLSVVEFADFECPACKTAGLQLEALESRYPGRLEVRYVNYPLCGSCNPEVEGARHPHACLAAKIGIVLKGHGKFERFAHLMFADQGPLDDARIDAIVTSLGEDAALVRRDAGSAEVAAILTGDIALGRQAQVQATPTLLIEGQASGTASVALIAQALGAPGSPAVAAAAGSPTRADPAYAAPPVVSTTGRTYYVANGGSDNGVCSQASPCATPWYAFDQVAGPGDLVQVAPGTYDNGGSEIHLNSSGSAGHYKVLTCATRGACRIQNSVSGNNTVIWIPGSYVVFDGFEVTNTSSAGNNLGFYITGSNISITRNIVHHIEAACDSMGGAGIGVATGGGSGNVIDSNLVYDIGWTVATCSGKNTVHGINFETNGSATGTVTNNIVYHVLGGWGIQFQSSSVGTTGSVISNNLLFSNGNGGIVFNEVGGKLDYDIVANNIILGNGTNQSKCGIYEFVVSGTHNLYRNNDVSGNAGGNYCFSTGSQTAGISVDPSLGTTFVDWRADGSGDYHLRSGSPAIAAGTSTGAPSTDFDGNPRSGAIDLGPYRYGNGGTAVAPSITAQPADRSVTSGQTATFGVSATGSPTPTYQWQKNGVAISGATASTYTTPATVAADSGATFRVVVANSAGSVTSGSATLTVTTPTGGGLPAPWIDGDIGGVSRAGSAAYASGTFTVTGPGGPNDDIWRGADAFHFVYQPLSGDGTIVARVASVANDSRWTKAGVMIRETLAPDSPHATCTLTPANGFVFLDRKATGDITNYWFGSVIAPPAWVKLVRSGSTFSGYQSTDGATWTLVGSDTIAMTGSVYVGLADIATTATFTNVSVSGLTHQPPPPGNGTGIARQWWLGIAGTAVADLTSNPAFPASPSGSDQPTAFEAPTDVADAYGERLCGYVTAPIAGAYVFTIASDDNGELWLATDGQPASKRLIASVPGWTGPREWTRFPEQRSASIQLAAGQRCYVEALMKEGVGGDNLAVAWQLPDGTVEAPIPGNRLIPFVPDAPASPARVSLAVDNQLTDLYVNGLALVPGPHAGDWTVADTYTVPGAVGTIAVRAVNSEPGSYWGGFIARITQPDGSVVVSDTGWRVFAGAPPTDAQGRAWYAADYDDSAWAMATTEGAYGVAPWGTRDGLAPVAGARWIWAGALSQGVSPVCLRKRIGAAAGSSPYGGVARALPGTVQAEDFDDGGEGAAYHDLDPANQGGGYRATGVDIRACVDVGGGWQVGWMGGGEWMAYTVDVAIAGSFDLTARVASGSSGATVHVAIDGVDRTGPMSFGSTGGWDSWQDCVHRMIPIGAGRHVVRLMVDGGSLDLGWLRFDIAAPSGTAALPPAVSPGGS